jgi:hypothetical protein
VTRIYRVVPISQFAVLDAIEEFKFLISNLYSFFIFTLIKICFYAKSSLCFGALDEIKKGIESFQRVTGRILANLTKYPMFNMSPFTRASWKMRHSYFKIVFVGHSFLKKLFKSARSSLVTATTVCQNKHAFRSRILGTVPQEKA